MFPKEEDEDYGKVEVLPFIWLTGIKEVYWPKERVKFHINKCTDPNVNPEDWEIWPIEEAQGPYSKLSFYFFLY